MRALLVTKGLPASGKSTWAKEYIKNNHAKRINKDLLREMLDDSVWTKGNEKFILSVRDTLILKAIEEGWDVIVDDTNLHPKHYTHIEELVKDKAIVTLVDFTDVPLSTCLERDKKRDKPVGEKDIRDMYKQFLAPKITPPPYKKGGIDAVICDLDGTLALLNGRNPYDASTCENDILNKHVADLLKDKNVIFVSGRTDNYKEQTINFLNKHNLDYIHLFMRKTGDNRKDSIIKEEIYREHIEPFYNITHVFDDRLQVCRMWYNIGLPLFRVGDPDADF